MLATYYVACYVICSDLSGVAVKCRATRTCRWPRIPAAGSIRGGGGRPACCGCWPRLAGRCGSRTSSALPPCPRPRRIAISSASSGPGWSSRTLPPSRYEFGPLMLRAGLAALGRSTAEAGGAGAGGDRRPHRGNRGRRRLGHAWPDPCAAGGGAPRAGGQRPARPCLPDDLFGLRPGLLRLRRAGRGPRPSPSARWRRAAPSPGPAPRPMRRRWTLIVAAVRRQGFATTANEGDTGLAAVSVPVFDAAGAASAWR